jgi:acid phosphatase type 7
MLFIGQNSTQVDDPVVLVGAGDIASCVLPGDEATARLLADIPGTIFTTGDNVYPDGSAEYFNKCYDPSWGQFKARTRPSPGNHDLVKFNADAYHEYFGMKAGPVDRGYYSYNLGAWHIISLNSNVDIYPGYSQDKWLRADLEKNRKACTLVYWHHPLFASGPYTDRPRDIQHVWDVLYEYGVDVVVNGHIHMYERFAPQNPSGKVDRMHGIREFIVGTGGATLRLDRHMFPIQPNSEVRNNTTWGVIKFTLYSTSYDWEFIPVEGGTFHDTGHAECVSLPDYF